MATKAQRLGIAADNELAPLLVKRNNYFLRSAQGAGLRRVAALASASRIKADGFGLPSIVKADGSWAGYCSWEISQLQRRGLVEKVEFLDRTAPAHFRLTRAGNLALEAALRALGERIDTASLLVEIDARRDAGL